MSDVEVVKQMRAAVLSGNLAQARQLLDQHEGLLHRATAFGTWLHVAAGAGHLELAQELLDRGLDVNARGGTFEGAALNLAASAGHAGMIKLLLDAGSEMDTSDPQRNPLFGAIYGGHIEVVRLLIGRAIDFRVRYTGRSMKNMDAEAFAREWGQTEIADYLASLGSRDGRLGPRRS